MIFKKATGMFHVFMGIFLIASFFSLSQAASLSQEAPQPKLVSKDTRIKPASLAGFSDKGFFRVFVNEEALIEVTYEWLQDGAFSSTAVTKRAGQSTTIFLNIEVDKSGFWTKILKKTPKGDIVIDRNGAVAMQTFGGKSTTIDLKDGAVIFESPVLLSQIIRAYDVNKGGKQTFPMFVISGTMIEASLERQADEERMIAGKDRAFRKYVLGIPGVDIILLADDSGKIFLESIPCQNVFFVRAGYEGLMKTVVTDPLLSAPIHEIILESNVMIPMRDGIKLATDIYRPKAEGKYPVILIRTPYEKKAMNELDGRFYARRGYVVAAQDCRGRFSSQGVWEPFINEPKDGYDAVEWLASQPWSSGKVGMIGASYVGWVQWWAAKENPPHLTTIVPNVSPPDPFFNLPYEYGAFFIHGAIWWANILESNASADISGAAISKIGEKQYGKLLKDLPVIDLDKKILGKENPYWRKWIEHPTNDAYWERANFLDSLNSVNIPVFHQSGWFDGDGIGTKLNYARMKAAGHPNQKLVLGPWGHTDKAARMIEDIDFGPQAIIDLPTLYLRWFDYWLKGVDNGIVKEPLVKIFVMNANKWLEDNVYPLASTLFQKWYLASGGNANTSLGDGLLTAQAPPEKTATDAFIYDPADPTPNPDFMEEAEGEKKGVKSVEEKKEEANAYHEKITRERKDILVFQTKPFEKPLTFAGPISAILYASSSAKDTDWFMRLVWIKKDGTTLRLVEGKIRARFRKSMKNPELLVPGEICEYHLDLWQTGIRIPAGDSLRVEVASASFPTFSRNLNTGGHSEKETRFVKAEQKIFHSGKYPSHVLLPVIPEGDGK